MLLDHAEHLSSRKIVLASASPRRREILTLMRLPFSVVVSSFEENLDKASFASPAAYAVANATGKAREVAARAPDADLVVGSDTIVVLDGRILEKPKSEAESYAMLKALSGRSHTVVSAIALFLKGAEDGAEPAVALPVETEVTFSDLTDDLIYGMCGRAMCLRLFLCIASPAGSFDSPSRWRSLCFCCVFMCVCVYACAWCSLYSYWGPCR